MLSLKGVSVLDLTQRLPGPLATKKLLDLGAEVIKATPYGKEDAFSKTEELIFNRWFENINSEKKYINYKPNELQDLINQVDLVIVPGNFKQENYELKSKAVIKVHGDINKFGMHDLNALAVSKAFRLYVKNKKSTPLAPPFLPFAGINYGIQIALEGVSLLFKAQKEQKTQIKDLYLDEATKDTYDLFWDEILEKSGQDKFLHNGLFPCYNMYKTKDDQYIALACVEEHFWIEFVRIFNLQLQKDDRFSTDDKVIKVLVDLFNGLTQSEIIHRVGDHNICLTPIK